MSIEKAIEATDAMLKGTCERRKITVYGASNQPDRPMILHLIKFGDGTIQVSVSRAVGNLGYY